MKHIYLVRHGETVANRKFIHQGPHEPLSELGRKQAHSAALFFKDKGIESVVCSPYIRAQQTAQIIGEELGLAPLINEHLKEFRRPDYLYDRSHYSLSSLLYLLRLFIHQEDPDWDDDGAENMFAVRNRVEDAKTELAKIPVENLVAVSHAIFMDMFLELVCKEKDLTLLQYVSGLVALKKTPNTGIIHLYFDEAAPLGICAWQLLEFVDPRMGRQ